ncbi:hypothetical protein ACFQJC_04790 [Haloferax namakaokahaiae]|uniref:RelE toxin-related domain-containing protein n=1 Tax=Haloferax namakaokahaiae TaxID=1748331 RepID=A0ABD5ZC80_9EURY
MMAARQQGGQFRHQDGVVLWRTRPKSLSHPEFRLRQRGRGWSDANIRALWREGVPIRSKEDHGRIYRYHEESDLLLIAHYGCLQTVIPLWERPDHEQAQIRKEAREMQS